MKENLRKEIKEKRRKISKEEQRKKSKEIKEKLFSLLEYKFTETILYYISFDSEVFTHEIVKEALNEKRVVVPIINKEDFSLILSELKDWDDLEVGSYGILEPKKEKINKVAINEIDLIIVPGIAFDMNGNRLGQGKGYYDRLLKNSNAVKIALAYEIQIVDKVPTKENDIPVDMIISEKRIIKI